MSTRWLALACFAACYRPTPDAACTVSCDFAAGGSCPSSLQCMANNVCDDPDAPRCAPVDSGSGNPDAKVCFSSVKLGMFCVTSALPAMVYNSPQPLNTDTDCTDTPMVGVGSDTRQEACVVAASTFDVDAVVTVTGSRPLVLAALARITVAQLGVIDAASHLAGRPGPNADAPGMCANDSTTAGMTGQEASGGGAGGSFAAVGGSGGAGAGSIMLAPGGVADLVVPPGFHGGCAGGGGGAMGGPCGSGGHGGGAVYLLSMGVVDVSGAVNASGAAGAAGGATCGGGGGGAGGFIGVEAPSVVNRVLLFADGGGGGGGGGAGAGMPGSESHGTGGATGGAGAATAGDGGKGSLAGVGKQGSPGTSGKQVGGGGGGGGGGEGALFSP